jgi:Mg-chelatase subunit ChlD
MKVLRKLLYCIILALFFPLTGYAEEIVPEKEQIEIIFVIDSSGSMKTNDRSGIGIDMVQAFIDTMQTQGIRIGYVAYNNEILSYSAPETIETTEKRKRLKDQISSITYSGDTDIGLGVSHACELFSEKENTRRIMVLISDGETDLSAGSPRTEAQSSQELDYCMNWCRDENIPIYTIAFGQYDGSIAVLKKIAEETKAESYSAKNPEDLIEILYGIFQNNLFYRIQQFSNGTYAGGSQQITCVLDSIYVDEIDILLISSGEVGETAVQYGDEKLPLTNLSHYAVGKIENDQNSMAEKEITIHTATNEGQDLQVYVISYRGLLPVMNTITKAARNQNIEYNICFQNAAGETIMDADFYRILTWDLFCTDSNAEKDVMITKEEVRNGILRGSIQFAHSGNYTLNGILSDGYGSYVYPFQIDVSNTMPQGNIPEEKKTLVNQAVTYHLNEYFHDADGDTLVYSVPDSQEDLLTQIDGDTLTLTPQRAGNHRVTIQVSDGEDLLQYTYSLKADTWWQAYWWAIAAALTASVVFIWKLTHKPKPEIERLTEQRRQYHFSGKLNAYFLRQPQEEEEIPPLTFQMNRVKDGRVSLGDLFGEYPVQAEALQLNSIFLIADENRSMVLYHTSKSDVMVGNAIACRQLQYSIRFGDVIYITSQDGGYDLEIHYIAVFQ